MNKSLHYLINKVYVNFVGFSGGGEEQAQFVFTYKIT